MKIQDCRKSVKNFAIAMENVLRDNDHKGGWREMTDEEIIARMLEEIGEIIKSRLD